MRSGPFRDGLRVPRPHSPESPGEHLSQQLGEGFVLRRHVHDAQREASSELTHVTPSMVRTKKEHACARHERRTDELIRAGLLVIAVDENEPRPHAQKRAPGRLISQREVRHVPRQFDGGAKERRSQRIRRKDEYGVSAHVVTRAR